MLSGMRMSQSLTTSKNQESKAMSPIPHILPEKAYWMDRRLAVVQHNEFAYKAEAASSLEEWKQRRDFTREQVSLAAGLSPMPVRPPLEAKVWGHFKHEGTVIAKVQFESMPGLIVTGNLYFPEMVRNQAPGILCPHGHWSDGRLHSDERGSVPMRCLMLARLGFVVFSYDMVGYNDNNEILHRWPEDILREAALWGAGLFALQTWNSIRSLDFLCDLPEVDERRIGCTGASGGASQTWTLSVLDERVKVIAPVCMLSSHYQGGCQCEEGPLLRLNGVTSFDILSACAPRPLLLPAVTQDWTNLNPRYEIAALRKVYALFNAEDALHNFQLDAPHNYNKDTRERMYPWFTHWLLNQSLRETIKEDDIVVPRPEQLLHTPIPVKPTPSSTREHLTKITAHLCREATPDLKGLSEASSFRRSRVELVGEIVNNDLNLRDVAVRVTCPSWEMASAYAKSCIISRRDAGDVIPAVMVKPFTREEEKPACLLLDGGGKGAFFSGGNRSTILDMLISGRCDCLVPDLLGSGETAGMPGKSFRDESDPTFYAFNSSLFAMRVQDILTCLTLLHESGYQKLAVVATGEAVKPALCALAISRPLYAAAFDLEGQADTPAAWLQPLNFQPMIFKAGGMKGLAALANVRTLGLYKPSKELVEYANAASEVFKVPQRVAPGMDSFLRLAEYVICNYK